MGIACYKVIDRLEKEAGNVNQELFIFGEGTLTFQEFAMREPAPLASIHQAVLEYLRGRDDVVLFGAHAVNAYTAEPRMTQDVDVVAVQAEQFAAELCNHLGSRFHMALRVREVKDGLGYRIYQILKPKNRHLVDVRSVGELPSAQRLAEVLTVTPVELIAGKVRAYHHRRNQPKGGTDWRDLGLLFLTFPELKTLKGPVCDRLVGQGWEKKYWLHGRRW